MAEANLKEARNKMADHKALKLKIVPMLQLTARSVRKYLKTKMISYFSVKDVTNGNVFLVLV